jgi:hypothetical protein
MLTFTLGILLGGIITVVVAHLYYRQSYRDQELLWGKFSDELRELILSDTRSRLTVPELNDLLREKTIDPHSDRPFPYKVCPQCGSENIIEDVDIEADVEPGDDGEAFSTPIYFKALRCDDCGWRISQADRA